MPLELTQSRVQKIWIPVDHRPSLPRCECRRARGRAAGEGAPCGQRGHCVAGAGRALLCRLPSSGALGRAGRRPPRRPRGPAQAPPAPPRRPRREAGTARVLRLPWPASGALWPGPRSPRSSTPLAPGAQRDPETASARHGKRGARQKVSASGRRGKGRRRVSRPGPRSRAPAAPPRVSAPFLCPSLPPLLSLPLLTSLRFTSFHLAFPSYIFISQPLYFHALSLHLSICFSLYKNLLFFSPPFYEFLTSSL